jgi:hypothetical protein
MGLGVSEGGLTSGGQEEYTLRFWDGKRPPAVEVLVVAGGGGMSDGSHPAGGGPGGYIYVPSSPTDTIRTSIKVISS